MIRLKIKSLGVFAFIALIIATIGISLLLRGAESKDEAAEVFAQGKASSANTAFLDLLR